MQIKGIIKWLVVILGLACIWQLSFTFVTRNIEAEAQKQSDPKAYLNDKWDEKVYMGYTYGDCKSKELNLGLDLKGGMNVTLEIQAGDAIRVHALDDNRAGKKDSELIARLDKAIAKAEAKEREDAVTRATEGEDAANVIEVYLANMSKEDLQTIYGTTDSKVIAEDLNKYVTSSVENMHRVLGERIDLLGVVQPNIQQIRGTNRILVELPGVDDPENAAKLLASTANLEFWEVCDGNMSNALTSFLFVEADQLVYEALVDENPEIVANPFSSLLTQTYKFKAQDGTEQDGFIGGMIVAAAEKQNMAKVNEYLQLENVRARFDEITNGEVKLAWSNKNTLDGSRGGVHTLYALQGNGGLIPAMDGSGIVDATATTGQFGGYEVSMTMDSKAAIEWGNLTEKNINRPLAIVMDGVVYSAPNVNDRIDGGRSSISGNFTPKEAEDLANVLNSGKVPAPATIISYEVVGPTLGAESISAGLLSFVLAFVLVLIYMAFFYKTAGVMANIALVFNVLLLMGVLVSTGAVLTLPGIAGIVLTMGMAVDANVIIFERIKEELRGGKGIYAAIKDGFSNAYSAIIDGNLTTIITGVVLFLFGTGPVKGFATTLIIGILTSAFTAIFITRLLIDKHAAKHGKISFAFKWSENLLSNLKFDFIGKRFWAYAISAVIIVAGAISLTTKGLNLGVEFTGGSSYVVNFDQPVSVDQVRIALNDAFEKDGADAAHSSVEVKQYGGNTQVRIVTQYKPSAEQNVEAANQPEVSDNKLQTILYNTLKDFYKNPITMEEFVTPESDEKVVDYGITSSSEIGPAIAKDMTKGAVFSILFALVAIGLYIIFRFRKWQWAAGATVALAHDAFMIIALFSLLYSVMPFNLEVNQAFIAAILTIIGYSINDTVVIFDRIREYLRLYPKRDLKSTINSALSSTMMRTLNTSGTTLITLLAIFTFGGEAVRGFVFALMIGIVVGTYSSLFIASPLAYDMQSKKAKKQAHQE